jgi:transcription-repair coupling factor (superfamily II helicase)
MPFQPPHLAHKALLCTSMLKEGINVLTTPWDQIPAPCAAKKTTLGQVHGPACALTLLSFMQMHTSLTVVITADNLAAEQLENALTYFSDKNDRIARFPDWETLAYDHFSPHDDITSQRLRCLQQAGQNDLDVLIVPITTLLQKLAPPSFVHLMGLQFSSTQNIDLNKLSHTLQNIGYRRVSEVISHGEFAIRGALFDLFPMGSKQPYRIDLLDNEIDSIRRFCVDNQRSTDKVDSIELLNAKEFPCDAQAIKQFKHAWRLAFDPDPKRSPIYQNLSEQQWPAGIEYYQPLFFNTPLVSLFDHLPKQSAIVTIGETLAEKADLFWHDCQTRYEQKRHDATRPILPPEHLWQDSNTLFTRMKDFTRIHFSEKTQRPGPRCINLNTTIIRNIEVNHRHQDPLHQLKAWINQFQGTVHIAAESMGRREALHTLLSKANIPATSTDHWPQATNTSTQVSLGICLLDKSITLNDSLAIISEADLLGQHVTQSRRRKTSHTLENAFKNLAELNEGDAVVHLEHGIGRYLGLELMCIGDHESEFLLIEYQNNNKLYVPISSLHLISRYSATDSQQAPLHHLGSKQWEKTKKKAQQKAYDIAAELLQIDAQRKAYQGEACPPPNDDFYQFASEFPFETTPDQQKAIDEVLVDLSRSTPMNRLVCGDVGFGKTEVAMRAAFLLLQNQQQVAILVPTTLLAEQHGNNFKDRFANWPVTIEVLSRFKTASQQQDIIKKTNQGTVDIVIGTHALLKKGITFKRLGLIIIDEEHRFGVRHKEQLKKLRANTHVLTLTATPIPRTLNMALSKLRDLSIIATPPAKRLAIKTFIQLYHPSVIQEAVQRELHRGGQVFYLHNNVKTIASKAESLQNLLPESRIAIAHGQMPERQLEKVMADFYHQRYNLLLCSTIIENGIDIPSANTIIIDRADKLGLAQLHQLRGRVGRSHHQAYAYLLHPEDAAITNDARKRLEAIALLKELGAGFTLATQDLEIRGAGELLGDEQSGQMHEIGFELYLTLLEKATCDIREGRAPSELLSDTGPEIDLQLPALIPHDYLPDPHSRLQLYKRIANATDEDSLDSLQIEMIDRFGLLPQATKHLFAITACKLFALAVGIDRLNANPNRCIIKFKAKTSIRAEKLIKKIQREAEHYQLKGGDTLIIKLQAHEDQNRCLLIRQKLEALL